MRLLPFLLCLSSAAAVRADELRLLDGTVLIGRVQELPAIYRITTANGVVEVPRANVLRHRSDDELRAELQRSTSSAGDSAFHQLQLAERALHYELQPELWRFLDGALRRLDQPPPGSSATPAGEAYVRRRLEEVLRRAGAGLLPLPQGLAAAPVRDLLQLLRPDTSKARQLAIELMLASHGDGAAATRERELQQAAKTATSPRQRLAAHAALQRLAPNNGRTLALRGSLVDDSAQVRQALIAGLRHGNDNLPAAVDWLAVQLDHPDGRIRVRTAEALGRLGNPAAIPHLEAAMPRAGLGLGAAAGGQPRAYAAFTTQRAYVAGFDVEVAQAAAIAKPRIGVLQTGVVLDAEVVGVFSAARIQRSYQAALAQLRAATASR